jgi:hypothetical protein
VKKTSRVLIGIGLSLGFTALSVGTVWGQFPIPRPKIPNLPSSLPFPKLPGSSGDRQPAQDPPQTTPSSPQDRFNRNRDRSPAAASKQSPSKQKASGLPEEDQGILNELHRANVGKIVFTRQDYTIDAIQQSSFASDFDLGPPMFFRVYMARSAVNEMMGKPGVSDDRMKVASRIQYKARFTINGQTVDTTFRYFGEIEERNRYTTWRGQFINRNPMSQRLPGSDIFRELIAKGSSRGLLRPGTTVAVKMEVIPMVNHFENSELPPIVGEPVATGTFNLKINPGAINKADPHICIPAGPRNTAVEAQALAQARPTWLAKDAQPVAARMSQDTWEVVRNELTGIPLERKVDVLIIARNPEYCYSAFYRWSEPFAGNGFSTQSGSLSFAPFTRTYFPCSCLD